MCQILYKSVPKLLRERLTNILSSETYTFIILIKLNRILRQKKKKTNENHPQTYCNRDKNKIYDPRLYFSWRWWLRPDKALINTSHCLPCRTSISHSVLLIFVIIRVEIYLPIITTIFSRLKQKCINSAVTSRQLKLSFLYVAKCK